MKILFWKRRGVGSLRQSVVHKLVSSHAIDILFLCVLVLPHHLNITCLLQKDNFLIFTLFVVKVSLEDHL